jgi:hypothetical protein
VEGGTQRPSQTCQSQMSATRGKSVLDDCQPLAEKRDRRLVSWVSARLSQVPDLDLEV